MMYTQPLKVVLLIVTTALPLKLWAEEPKSDITEQVRYHPVHTHIPIPADVDAKGRIGINAPIGRHPQSPIIKVSINGQGPYYFMFDTGWSGAMVSRKVAEELKLPVVGSDSYSQVTPNQTIEVFESLHLAKKIKVGGVTIHNYALSVNNSFEDDVMMFKKVNEVGIDGIIGLNAFYGYMVTIDYAKEMIFIEQGSLSATDKGVLPYAKKYAVPNVFMNIYFSKIKKHAKQTFIVDTGYYAFIKVNTCHIPEVNSYGDSEKIYSYDYTGMQSLEYLAKLYGTVEVLPDYKLKEPYLVFSKNNCMQEPLGLIGRAFFDKNLITIDHDDRLVRIKNRH